MNHLNHIAIIMDGNGRWGLKNKKTRNYGHRKGVQVVQNIIKASIKKKIKYLTLFTFFGVITDSCLYLIWFLTM